MTITDYDQKILPGLKNGVAQYRKYNISVQVYGPDTLSGGYVKVPELCNGFTITNIGTATFKVNGKILFPSATPASELGDSISFGGNEGEIYTGNLQIQFLGVLGATPQVEVIFKYYIK